MELKLILSIDYKKKENEFRAADDLPLLSIQQMPQSRDETKLLLFFFLFFRIISFQNVLYIFLNCHFFSRLFVKQLDKYE